MEPKKNGLLLDRRLNGTNSVIEIKIDDSETFALRINNGPALINFWKFLEDNHLDYHDAVVELAQVLKIPVSMLQKLVDAGELGFLTVDASKNIQYYLDVRIAPKAISFLQSQQGEAGIKNKEAESSNDDG